MKKQLGQFYTKRAKYIIGNLLDIYPLNSVVIDPFAGEADLLNIISKKHKVIGYDIEPKKSYIDLRDSLLNPINYIKKWIITNPPYLARNKNNDKIIYKKYKVSDLYKASLKSIVGCNGGVVILPLNFLCDEDDSFRKYFLSKYKIIKLNIFEKPVFSNTTYTICSFSFIKEKNKKQIFNTTFFPSKEIEKFYIDFDNGYKIGSDFFNLLKNKSNIKVSRLLKGEDSPNSKLFLRAVDTGSEKGKINLTLKDEPFFGKITDRTFATIKLSKDFSLKQQQTICNKFNKILNFYRKKYHSLFLTNYRNNFRKRISFKTTYDLISFIIRKLNLL